MKKNYRQLENHSVAELETMALARDKNQRRDESLKDILLLRKQKLNDGFVFTPENIQHFLWLDRQLKDLINRLRQEGKRIIRHLNRETKKKDAFFNDYEMTARICPLIMEWNEDEQSMHETENDIYDLLNSCSFHGAPVAFDPRHRHECYFGDLNWNGMAGAKNGEFEAYHIGYALHELYGHSLWSLPDMVKINSFDAGIQIEYQRYGTEPIMPPPAGLYMDSCAT
ncbi:MAG: hypothetical protein LBP83_04235 [Dysgonamonadaceae bacterium]|jgi:hypothetical protein|nr:hypothetical protein [Dysgonamonadaceae bacterium]